jgi:hypothetical protein
MDRASAREISLLDSLLTDAIARQLDFPDRSPQQRGHNTFGGAERQLRFGERPKLAHSLERVCKPPAGARNLYRLGEKDRPGRDRSEAERDHYRLDQVVGGQKHRPRR